MNKKQASNGVIALNYYIAWNVIALVPLLVVGYLMGKYVTQVWLYVVVSLILNAFIFFFALKLSAKNVNKNFIVSNIKKVFTWSLGYLLVFNLGFLFLNFKIVGYISLSMVISLCNILIAAVILYIYTPKFVPVTLSEAGTQIN